MRLYNHYAQLKKTTAQIAHLVFAHAKSPRWKTKRAIFRQCSDGNKN